MVIDLVSVPRTASSAATVSSSTITCEASASLRQWPSAGPVRWLLIRAAETPILVRPYQAAMYSGRLGSRIATVLPRLSPRPAAQWA